ncbi:sodium-dependent neutral amino acid transporter B(0)AT2-like [Rhinatrema bivittatum]|uniref:sodium-dependent neutral amino acid transporter B(0)AT2-like n=1 Tax=Rhinatrema bivittatum TaxID=194408 RepID=UPI00112A3F8E|nr:sodium-dependent neutral amino acid transporter B(0)AT2-like [Rhinatrema bivittatum]XP_029440219.1 sodium-dependent neutral amino acid transporter B(0)AT2-like [Rhinatrema bivittatum]XP_029440220.1 sodium-dependent neutral amino acid transporter B(0)AT2-like [Rhinatrema bivittatum]XP_029440221.1 sodium-dependent neutral amino acid transporter B(0)AT2-like [Rhinatrema bivittatum]XP_029440222.1 sodium-dependent neutral amino acid transporter B(0)AT2-like [Rhinatrema bivittatum]XP_029440223.1 
MEKCGPELEEPAVGESSLGLLPEELAPRPSWGSKVQYILAQVGFSVGLGNVWRFPYLCHQNGGGAFLLLYFLLLGIIGIPLFFLELAAGQSIRQGSIGVWKRISPRLAGIGFASCVVCFFVALYYNVIIAWSLFYIFHSFQYPLPWESCPIPPNQTEEVRECISSSPSTYFWYRKALEITDSIEESGGLNGAMVGCLFLAWVVVCFSMIKGIKSSGKVMYFSSVFPYVVLLCFLIRGLLLEGAVDGIRIMFTPKLEIWQDIQVWRQAATQVFFALGLGFGSVIAYSSYNCRTNNCHFDAILVSFINFMTSILATLVVFAVLGFRANIITQQCIHENTQKLMDLIHGGSLSAEFLLVQNLSSTEYSQWYQRANENGTLQQHGIEDCRVENEVNKGVEGTGLAFIVFTEAMTLFPASPFWSVLFFFMLQNLGLSTMLGNMQGIITPLLDNFPALRKKKTLFTVACCLSGFVFGLIFVQRSGNYFVTMFDDYSATLPLIVVVIFENVAVAWVYGADRFMDDLEQMLGWRPWSIYKYTWKYVSILAMLGLLLASLIRMCFAHPTYRAWNMEQALEMKLEYPPWALGLLISLIALASFPIPALFLRQVLRESCRRKSVDTYSQCGYHQGDTADETGSPTEESPADPQCQANGFPPAEAAEMAETGKLLAEDSGEEAEEDEDTLLR